MPDYLALVEEAVRSLNDERGSTPAAIDAWIQTAYSATLQYDRSSLFLAIERGLDTGKLVAHDGPRGTLFLKLGRDRRRKTKGGRRLPTVPEHHRADGSPPRAISRPRVDGVAARHLEDGAGGAARAVDDAPKAGHEEPAAPDVANDGEGGLVASIAGFVASWRPSWLSFGQGAAEEPGERLDSASDGAGAGAGAPPQDSSDDGAAADAIEQSRVPKHGAGGAAEENGHVVRALGPSIRTKAGAGAGAGGDVDDGSSSPRSVHDADDDYVPSDNVPSEKDVGRRRNKKLKASKRKRKGAAGKRKPGTSNKQHAVIELISSDDEAAESPHKRDRKDRKAKRNSPGKSKPDRKLSPHERVGASDYRRHAGHTPGPRDDGSRKPATYGERLAVLERRMEHSERAHLLNFTWDELKAATNGFSAANRLGSGGFGEVFSGTLKGTPVAIKRLHRGIGADLGPDGRVQMEAELEILARYRSPQLVGLVGVSMPADTKGEALPCIVYQRMEGGDLADKLHPPGGQRANLPWWQRLKILIDVARGLVFLHTADETRAVVHLDIKPENILLDAHGSARLGDFGLVQAVDVKGAAGAAGGAGGGGGGAGAGKAPRHVARERTISVYVKEKLGTPGYKAPEYAESGSVTVKCDSYSFAVVVAELLSVRYVHDHEDDKSLDPLMLAIADASDSQLSAWVDRAAGWPKEVSVALWKIAKGCGALRRSQRWSMDRALGALEQILESQRKVIAKLAAREAAPRDADDSRKDVECDMCLDDHKNVVLVPCGHLMCEACAGKYAEEKCPTCASAVERVMRFYW